VNALSRISIIETTTRGDKIMTIYVYRTNFRDDRNNFCDIISAASAAEAEREATQIIRGVDEIGHGTDEFAEADIICEIASDLSTIAFERIKIKARDGVNIFEVFPDVQFSLKCRTTS
tara:strand:+ start:1428 stop:1781 length:354 start_codon:yes stop_codon:yes gene_type:complete